MLFYIFSIQQIFVFLQLQWNAIVMQLKVKYLAQGLKSGNLIQWGLNRQASDLEYNTLTTKSSLPSV